MKFEIEPLVAEMLDRLPNSVWTSNYTTFFDPAIGGGQFVRAIEQRLREHGHSDANICSRVFGFEESNLHIRFAVNKYNLVGQYVRKPYEKFFELDNTMKFDVVVGNPPYQDGTKEGGQNKIYNMFCKKSLDLVKDNGLVACVTPTSALKESKRFSLVNMKGLKLVDFRANTYFDVGINICWWLIDKTYTSSDVTVIDITGSSVIQSSNTPIYDFSIVDPNFASLYKSLKETTDTPEKRMFRENNFGDAVEKTKSSVYHYPIYSITKDGSKAIFGYSKRIPFFYKKKKIVIPMTKTLTDKSILVDTNDFYVAYLCTEVSSKKEISNIKSFIMSDYFKEHSTKWKNLDGYGFNYALKYLPPFDTTREWTNDEVKEFLESYVK